MKSLSKSQRVTWLKKWWPQIAEALGADPEDETARQSFYGATFRDVPRHAERVARGERIRFKHLDDSDFDRLKRAYLLATGQADLNTALNDVDENRPGSEKAKRYLFRAREIVQTLKDERLHGNVDAAIAKITRERFEGVAWEQMSCEQLHQLITTLNRWLKTRRKKQREPRAA